LSLIKDKERVQKTIMNPIDKEPKDDCSDGDGDCGNLCQRERDMQNEVKHYSVKILLPLYVRIVGMYVE